MNHDPFKIIDKNHFVSLLKMPLISNSSTNHPLSFQFYIIEHFLILYGCFLPFLNSFIVAGSFQVASKYFIGRNEHNKRVKGGRSSLLVPIQTHGLLHPSRLRHDATGLQ
jgi:hypothetical protein